MAIGWKTYCVCRLEYLASLRAATLSAVATAIGYLADVSTYESADVQVKVTHSPKLLACLSAIETFGAFTVCTTEVD